MTFTVSRAKLLFLLTLSMTILAVSQREQFALVKSVTRAVCWRHRNDALIVDPKKIFGSDLRDEEPQSQRNAMPSSDALPHKADPNPRSPRSPRSLELAFELPFVLNLCHQSSRQLSTLVSKSLAQGLISSF